MKTFFGTVEGKEIFLYTLENERIIMKVSEFGAALVALIDKGNQHDENQKQKTDIRHGGCGNTCLTFASFDFKHLNPPYGMKSFQFSAV